MLKNIQFVKIAWLGILILIITLGYVTKNLVSLPQQTPPTSADWLMQKSLLQGYVSSIPVAYNQDKIWRFNFIIQRINWGEGWQDFNKKVRLSWYHSKYRPKKIQLQQYWQLNVKLKPINGTVNPAGFDYERWAFSQHLQAVGYVLNNRQSRQLTDDEFTPTWWSSGLTLIAKIRHTIADKLQLFQTKYDLDETIVGLLEALTIGNRSKISDSQWQAFQVTGTAHLLAISGLHIGLVAIVFGGLFSFLWRRSVRLVQYLSAPTIFALSGTLVATLYAMIAGFQIPAQRAFIMLVIVMLATFSKRFIPPWLTLLGALLMILVIDSRAVLATGFYLSFLAIAIIYSLLHYWKKHKPDMMDNADDSIKTNPFTRLTLSTQGAKGGLYAKIRNYIHQYTDFQQQQQHTVAIVKLLYFHIALTVTLIPILLYVFQNASIISPLCNLIIAPLIGILVVPLMLLSLGFIWHQGIFNGIIWLNYQLLDNINDWLLYFSQWQYSGFSLPSPTLLVTVISTCLLWLIFIQKDWRLRILSMLIVIMLLYPKLESPAIGTAKVMVLDVGQGLSLLVQTHEHLLIYDTGKIGNGKRVILPILRQLRATPQIIVISHHDNDHYGGYAALEKSLDKKFQRIDWRNCHNKRWQWDQVQFSMIQYQPNLVSAKSPTKGTKSKPNKVRKVKDNNLSCVLMVTAKGGQRLLIPGDIEKRVERYLVDGYANQLTTQWLIVPHQGSLTSSSKRFLDTVIPEDGKMTAIVPTGFKNRFRHPHPKVIQRYRQRNIPVYDTACSGAVQFMLGVVNAQKSTNIQQTRKDHPPFWRRQC